MLISSLSKPNASSIPLPFGIDERSHKSKTLFIDKVSITPGSSVDQR